MPRRSPKSLPQHENLGEPWRCEIFVCLSDYRQLINNTHCIVLSPNQRLLKEDLKQRFALRCVFMFSDIFGLFAYYYEQSELLIDGGGNKMYAKNERRHSLAYRSFRRAIASSVHAAAAGSAYPIQILPASESELLPRSSGGVRLAYTDPSGERR